MAYPAVRTTKEDDNVVFSFLQQFFTPDQPEALERKSSFCTRRSAQNDFLCRKSLPRRKRKKETLNVLLLLKKTRIRNVRRTSKHFPTNKVDFVTNNVDLRTKRTMTVSRNATNDFRTERARLAYGSRPYMQFPVFGGDPRARSARETLNPHISETAGDSPINTVLKMVRNRLGNLIKVVWKLYEVV